MNRISSSSLSGDNCLLSDRRIDTFSLNSALEYDQDWDSFRIGIGARCQNGYDDAGYGGGRPSGGGGGSVYRPGGSAGSRGGMHTVI